MKNKIEVFNNEQFGQIRVIIRENEPWFVAVEVCNVLGIKNSRSAVSKLDDDEKDTVALTDGTSGNPNKTIINEAGLYSLILTSRKKEAKLFKRWITHEVVPSIRKHGMYMTDNLVDIIMQNPEKIGQMFLVYAEEKKKNQALTVENDQLKDTVIHKENVIVGLTKDIDLAAKRARINQIIKYGVKDKSQWIKRWSLLYSEFEKKYHVNLSMRFENHKNKFKPKLQNKMDVIDRELNMVAETYEICCKLFENDVKELLKEWEVTVVRQS